jgi:predicted dehydrogenase
LGSIGRRHHANLKQIAPDSIITVWHQHSVPSQNAPALEAVDYSVFALEAALETKPQFAFVTSPATLHVPTALQLAQHDIHLLIEKPLSDRLDGVDQLLRECGERRLALLVGYNYRFSPSLQLLRATLEEGRIGRVLTIRAEVGQYLPDWRAGVDYRHGVSARRELGGGVLLELSHEIDYVRWLVGEVCEVSARVAHVSDLDIDVEDTAEIVLGFANGAIGSIHLDMIQRAPIRTCRVVGSEGTLVWDGLTDQLRCYSSASHNWTDLWPATKTGRNEMYLAELRHFVDCVRGSATSRVTGEDGRRVLQVALAARQSSLERRMVSV